MTGHETVYYVSGIVVGLLGALMALKVARLITRRAPRRCRPKVMSVHVMQCRLNGRDPSSMSLPELVAAGAMPEIEIPGVNYVPRALRPSMN